MGKASNGRWRVALHLQDVVEWAEAWALVCSEYGALLATGIMRRVAGGKGDFLFFGGILLQLGKLLHAKFPLHCHHLFICTVSPRQHLDYEQRTPEYTYG
jgi:hypothetical protein